MDKKIKLQIKNRLTGGVIFEYESSNNTIKKTVEEAVKRDANLRGADLRGVDLCGANLCGANLCGANLCDANLCDADLCGANLCGANLCGANLCGANLCGANLCDADLCGCVIDYNDQLNGYGATSDLIDRICENFGIRIADAYQNHDTFSSRWGAFWRNLIIIRKWIVVEKEEKKINLTDEQKSIIKAFAKIHDVQSLKYVEHEDYGGFVISDTNGDDKTLDFPSKIEELEDKRTYTLAELMIE